jgi:hypothetical protein
MSQYDELVDHAHTLATGLLLGSKSWLGELKDFDEREAILLGFDLMHIAAEEQCSLIKAAKILLKRINPASLDGYVRTLRKEGVG